MEPIYTHTHTQAHAHTQSKVDILDRWCLTVWVGWMGSTLHCTTQNRREFKTHDRMLQIILTNLYFRKTEGNILEVFLMRKRYMLETGGNSSIGKVFAVQTWGSEFFPRTQESQPLWHIPALSWRQEDPWSLLAIQPNLHGDLQAEWPCFRKQGGKQLSNNSCCGRHV